MRRYGKGVIEHELYLRRMTELSLSAFWLLSTVWLLRAWYPDGNIRDVISSLFPSLWRRRWKSRSNAASGPAARPVGTSSWSVK